MAPARPATQPQAAEQAASVYDRLTEAGLTPVRTIATWPEGPPPGGYFLVLFKKA